MKYKNKKAQNQIGIAIIAMAILLLLGSMFVDNGGGNKSSYLKSKSSNNDEYPQETYLFYLNKTTLGRQDKVTESFPNVAIGAKEENNIIYMGNNFKIKSTPFSKVIYAFDLQFTNVDDLNNYLFYFSVDKITGNNDLIIKVNGNQVYKNQARSSEIPIRADLRPYANMSKVKVTFEIEKPQFYELFNWNSYEIKELKVMENIQDKDNNVKEFDFQIDKEFLERVELNVVIDCKDTLGQKKPVKVNVNEFTIADFVPECESRYKSITKQVPTNILNTNHNEVIFETKGYYKVAYSINKIYFNDKDTYKFTINSFNDIIDVVMYGDFNEDVIDVRLNSQLLSLKRDEIKSIIPYLRFGSNELKILTKPVEIDEFIIEKNEFLEY